MGFNLLSLANNHFFDCGSFGIISSIEQTKKRGFTYAGTGKNIEEAATPGYLET
jgi:poly-gamma-glutamate synthesis protein (capsule biosynthesis protein)